MKKLEGDRVFLRRINENDIKRIVQLSNDSEVSEFITIPFPYTYELAYDYFLKSQEWIKRKTDFIWCIIVNNEIIGTIALKNINLDFKSAEIGYWLGKNYWNNGYMSESIELVLDYIKKEYSIKFIYANVFKANINSILLLTYKGFNEIYSINKNWKNKGIIEEIFLIKMI